MGNRYLLAAIVFMAGCGELAVDSRDSQDSPSAPALEEAQPAPVELTEEVIVMPPGPVSVRSGPRRLPQVVFVNFEGPTISDCACSDAPGNRSLVIGRIFGASTVDFAPYTNVAAQNTIVSKLRGYYADYAVDFVTTRPAGGDYTMVVISPTSGPHHGVAPQDCGNTNRNDIAFVYKIGSSSADTIARFAAHELGHSFGLAHVTDSTDIMQWASSGSAFERSTLDKSAAHNFGACVSGDVQDEPALLGVNLGPRVPESWNGTFVDDDGSTFESSIEKIAAAGITSGCGQNPPRYCPDDSVTRGQMAAFLTRALSLPPAGRDYFVDDTGSIFEDAINRLAASGITTGCGGANYCPSAPVTRGQMAVFLTRALGLPPSAQDYFDDDGGKFYEESANRMYESAITVGCGTRRYCGDDPVTRGQMAAFLTRALNL